MLYSAIMNELIHEVIDEAVKKNKRKGSAFPPPGAAYSASFTCHYADVASFSGGNTVDPDA